MTTRVRRIPAHGRWTRTSLCVALAAAVLVSSGCTSGLRGFFGPMVAGAVGEALDTEVTELPPEPPPGPHTSQYLWGPVPGWEYWGLMGSTYALPPSLFEIDLFAGACPGLHIALDGGPVRGPWAALVGPDGQWITLPPPPVVDPHYHRFGQVPLGWGFDPLFEEVVYRTTAWPGGACTSVGGSLLAMGRRPRPHMFR